MNLIGIDFSINKPAACILSNNKFLFYGWPYNLKEEHIEILNNSSVNIISRKDDKLKGNTLSLNLRYEIENANYLSNLIFKTLKFYLNIDTYIAFEGLSYASIGDVALQLGGYKYILMSKLSQLVPLDNMFTYSPITIKSIAGCAKKGMGKKEMINEFIKNGPVCKFRLSLYEHPEKFQSPKVKNWITHIDDLVDAYYTLKTLQIKENLI